MRVVGGGEYHRVRVRVVVVPQGEGGGCRSVLQGEGEGGGQYHRVRVVVSTTR